MSWSLSWLGMFPSSSQLCDGVCVCCWRNLLLAWIIWGSSSLARPHPAAPGWGRRQGRAQGCPWGHRTPRGPPGHDSRLEFAPGVLTGTSLPILIHSFWCPAQPAAALGCSALPEQGKFPNPEPLFHSKPQNIKGASRAAQQGPGIPKNELHSPFSVPWDVLPYPSEVERVPLVDGQADDVGDFKGVNGSEVETGAEGQSQPCPAPSALQSARSSFLCRGNSALNLGFTAHCRGPGPELSVLPAREMQEILSGNNPCEEENPSPVKPSS